MDLENVKTLVSGGRVASADLFEGEMIRGGGGRHII
jgi:hypothetical protein